MIRARSRTACLLAAGVLGAASLRCGHDRDPQIDAAIDRAIRFLADPVHIYGHAGYYLVQFLHRRFDIEAFADIPDRYRSFRLQSLLPATGVDLFERLIDPDARLVRERLPTVPHPVDRLTIEALYCDQLPVSTGYESRLRDMVSEGRYELTHLALAIAWLDENRCGPRLPALRAEVAEKMAAEVRVDGGSTTPRSKRRRSSITWAAASWCRAISRPRCCRLRTPTAAGPRSGRGPTSPRRTGTPPPSRSGCCSRARGAATARR